MKAPLISCKRGEGLEAVKLSALPALPLFPTSASVNLSVAYSSIYALRIGNHV